MTKFKKRSALFALFAVVILMCFFLVGCGEETTGEENEPAILRIDKLVLTMDVYDAYDFTIQYEGSAAVVWATSDENVVTVTDGCAYAQSAGSAIVSVTAGKLKKECVVTVKDSGLVPLVIGNLPDDSCTLYVGDGYDIVMELFFNGKLYGDASFTYTASNDNVSVSSDGVILAKKQGDAEITVQGDWRGFKGETLAKKIKVKVLSE